MFGINGGELLVLIVLALLVIGPEKLPELAQQLARVTREVKKIAVGAREKVQEELGDEYEELANLDPRQYDPRRIVREALADEEPARAPSAAVAARRAARARSTQSAAAAGGTSASAAGETGAAAAAGTAAAGVAAAAGTAAAGAAAKRASAPKSTGSSRAPRSPERPRPGEVGYVVPYDAEAT